MEIDSTTEIINLKTNDDNIISTSQDVLRCSRLLTSMIRLCPSKDPNEPVFLEKISKPILEKVLVWCKQHKNDPISEIEDSAELQPEIHLDTWDLDFFNVDQSTLFEIIIAANILDIPGLLDGAAKTVADMIRGKSPEEIRKVFNIKNDFTAEEEELLKNENKWIDDFAPTHDAHGDVDFRRARP